MLQVFWENFFSQYKKDDNETIKNCTVFQTLSPRELRFLKKVLHTRMYTQGEIIFKPLSGMGVYLVSKGQVGVLHGDPENPEQSKIISNLQPGDFFGELALVSEKVYQNLYAQATEPCRLLSFYRTDLEMVLERRPSIGIKILKQLCWILSYRLRKAEEKILETYTK